MFGAILAGIISLAPGLLGSVLGHLEKKADSETERQRIRSLAEQNAANNQAAVIVAGMQHTMFWVAWSIAALPMSAWFGWGLLDTLFNGALPDVAEIPPGLQPWAQSVWNNIFFSGAAAVGITGAAQIIGGAIARRK